MELIVNSLRFPLGNEAPKPFEEPSVSDHAPRRIQS